MACYRVNITFTFTQAEAVGEWGAEADIWVLAVEVAGDWRRIRNEEFHVSCCPPNIIWVIKSEGKAAGPWR